MRWEEPTDKIHDMWSEILNSPPVWDNVLEIPGRASKNVMDPMLVYFHNLDRAMSDGFGLDPLIREEEVPF